MEHDVCKTDRIMQLSCGRFEPLHLSFSSPCRSVRVVGSIMQVSALSVFDGWKQLTLSDASLYCFQEYSQRRIM
jgi:hypothetical protein